ncbi:hypothetical protein [Ruminococcus sp. FC2018]|uniref:hypothetical protein n=1 Tax=Ruminococcus sp. FC2018 TaxID=1410617 RepID=UPI00049022FC
MKTIKVVAAVICNSFQTKTAKRGSLVVERASALFFGFVIIRVVDAFHNDLTVVDDVGQCRA